MAAKHRRRRTSPLLVAALVATLLDVTLLAPGALAGQAAAVVNTVAPTVQGKTVYDERLKADPGEWQPDGVTYTYRWLRDGERIRGATSRSYRLGLDDLRRRISVRVTATTQTGEAGTAESDETSRVSRATLRNTKPPSVSGILRYTHAVRARPGRWSASPVRIGYRWLRDGEPIARARSARYRFRPQDVGDRIRAQVTARAPGYTTALALSPVQRRIGHRVDVRRRVTYSVETRGRITASLKLFKRYAQQTYDDPRGWRGSGVQFRRVARGGSFTLVLAEASEVPRFSSVCSAEWSCRVGRYVIINQLRWKHASPAWNAANGSLRSYRNMVVNHETGHWLGRGHAGCPRRGALAPVMMQQSKGLDGCRFNPWPTRGELGG